MRKISIFLAMAFMGSTMLFAEVKPLSEDKCQKINDIVKSTMPGNLVIGKVEVSSIEVDSKAKVVRVKMNENFAYIPFDRGHLDSLRDNVKESLGKQYAKYKVVFEVNERSAYDYLYDSKLSYTKRKNKEKFVYSTDPVKHPTHGLDGKIIAMWQSHGWYFEQSVDRWQWQRARIFQTVEDLYTQSFVMPYLMPMLENAGAYVISPRERDTRSVELIVDNDGGNSVGKYEEGNTKYNWTEGGVGFAYKQKQYEGFENPFKTGTYRQIKSVKKKSDTSVAKWRVNVPETGKYAVYVSYATVENSAKDAHYTVNSSAGKHEFIVNQTMGGGTWVYLGHFYFTKKDGALIELENASSDKNAIITADAVKIGGGMGNIARKASDVVTANVKSSESDKKAEILKPRIKSDYAISGYPRFTEAARYWLQWAGIPDSVYSPSNGANDYTDDYKCRGVWVNYLAGGSSVLPKQKGLNIPVDMSFAFHSDAGTTMDNTIIGTLGIYCTKGDKYENGTDRLVSHKLTNYVMTNICNDVAAKFDSQWVRRGMWDKSYFEARVPEVPTMLLELLSHQNLADMRYGLDPAFRFTVSRAIYKGIVEFFANQEGIKNYEFQPLPVNSFAVTPAGEKSFKLTWKPTADTLSTRADAKSYIVYERTGEGGFRQVAITENTEYTVTVSDNAVHSYQIVAQNNGGISFPSETLSLGVADNSKGNVMVVNGFTRVSAPDSFDSGEIAGFMPAYDNGVPYINDISYIGEMVEFRRELPWMTDEACGFGTSRSNYETKVIAGNTFDFPAVHGQSILDAGYSFVSSSLEAVENGRIDLKQYKVVDLILGKQKTTVIGRGEKADKFAIFSDALQSAVKQYCEAGGNVFVSGSYVASDIWDNKKAEESKKEFASKVLGYKWGVGQAAYEGEVKFVPTYFDAFTTGNCTFAQKYNEDIYAVESPDAVMPADKDKGCTLLRYSENNISAGVVNDFGGYKTCVVGFPFETIKCKEQRDNLMRQVLDFFTNEKK